MKHIMILQLAALSTLLTACVARSSADKSDSSKIFQGIAPAPSTSCDSSTLTYNFSALQELAAPGSGVLLHINGSTAGTLCGCLSSKLNASLPRRGKVSFWEEGVAICFGSDPDKQGCPEVLSATTEVGSFTLSRNLSSVLNDPNGTPPQIDASDYSCNQ